MARNNVKRISVTTQPKEEVGQDKVTWLQTTVLYDSFVGYCLVVQGLPQALKISAIKLKTLLRCTKE
jgi:hypothetical protein